MFPNKSLSIPCNIGIICFCPANQEFEKYKNSNQIKERLFLCLHPDHVMLCTIDNINIIVLSEVYGGPVTVSLVEELHYYGISHIIGIGYVGSFDNNYPIGTNVICAKTLSELGTTPHYLQDEFIESNDRISDIFNMESVVIWTTNAIYREYKSDVESAKIKGCQCVNMDTSHFFASCKLLNIQCCYIATVSDFMNEIWTNELIDAVSDDMNIVLKAQNLMVDMVCHNIKYIYVFMK